MPRKLSAPLWHDNNTDDADYEIPPGDWDEFCDNPVLKQL